MKYLIKHTSYLPGKELYLFQLPTSLLDHVFSQLPATDQLEISKVKHPKRKLELTLKAYALSCLFPKDTIIKDLHGKPFLASQNAHIGISHSGNYLAIVVGAEPCSVDLEIPKDKIFRLKEKFCTVQEKTSFTSKEDLYKVWMGKECVFKLLGQASPSFFDYELRCHNKNYYLTYEADDYPLHFGTLNELQYCVY